MPYLKSLSCFPTLTDFCEKPLLSYIKAEAFWQPFTLEVLYPELFDIINQCRNTPERLDYHPEGNTFTHIDIVFQRAHRTKDIDLIAAALFHDLGKPATLIMKKGFPQMPGHEDESVKILDQYRKLVEDWGCNFDNVRYIVENHMRIKHFDNMKKSKRKKLQSHKAFYKLVCFSHMDKMLVDFDPSIYKRSWFKKVQHFIRYKWL